MLNKITKEEQKALAREVKKATGYSIKDITIEAFGHDFIEYSYYRTSYAKATNDKTFVKIERRK